jgi:hypothetical protein
VYAHQIEVNEERNSALRFPPWGQRFSRRWARSDRPSMSLLFTPASTPDGWPSDLCLASWADVPLINGDPTADLALLADPDKNKRCHRQGLGGRQQRPHSMT